MKRRLGFHVRSAGGLLPASRRALEAGCNTFQIMSGNPSAWKPGTIDPGLAESFRRFTLAYDLRPVFLHAGYLINLSCRSGRNAPIYAKSLQLLQATLDRAALLGCAHVVVHLGSRRGSTNTDSLSALTEGLARLKPAGLASAAEAREQAPMLLLENGAGCGECVGSTFEELGVILRAARDRRVDQPLGICLDTAHMWGAGLPMKSGAAVNRLITSFDQSVGIEHLRLIHFNDSSVEAGSRKDRHEHIGRGQIPLPALRQMVRDIRLRTVPAVMETPGSTMPSDEQRMNDLRALIRGQAPNSKP
jgi:deoxyribonuclease-4